MPFINFPVFEEGDFDAPETLYHYTTIDGFLGVLSSNSLWASECRNLNDSTEYSHGREIFEAEIKRRARNAKGEAKKFYSEYRESPSFFESNSTLVASLTENGDLLSQWRAYGGGCSIGFSFDALKNLLGSSLEWGLVKCIYNVVQQRELVDSLIQRLLEGWRQGPPQETTDAETGITYTPISFHTPALLRMLQEILPPAFKSPAFAEEQEWRLVRMENIPGNLKFRSYASRIIPYEPFKFESKDGTIDPNLIREVVIGPSPHPELMKNTVALALKAHGFNARVVTSDCPYRSW